MSCNHMYYGAICQKCEERKNGYVNFQIKKSELNFYLNKSQLNIYRNSKDNQETKMPKSTKKTAQPREDSKKEEPAKEPIKYQFTYQQMKKVSELFEQKTGLKFWINLSKEQQEAEKATPTDNEYYRLAYTVYNDFPLFNVVRYHAIKDRIPKGKAYSTINLKSFRCTMNSQNKFVFTESEIETIKDALNLEPKKDLEKKDD